MFRIENGVGDEFTITRKAANLLETRRRNFDRLFAQFDAWLPVTCVVTDGREFVNSAERGLITARDEFGADSPDVDFGALQLETFDQIFVEIVGSDTCKPNFKF